MEDMADKITKLLEDDKSVDMLKAFAGSFGNTQPEDSQNSAKAPDLSKLMTLASGFKDDDRLRLMQALRPFVSEHKRESLDSLANILRILQLVSLFGGDLKLF